MIYTLTLNPALDRELTVPELVMDQVLRAGEMRIDYGGKGFNVSRALLALRMESTALGFIGGEVGERLKLGLSNLGIHTDFVQVAEETRTNLSIVDANHTHYLKVNEPGPLVSPAEATALLEKIKTLAAPGDWWVIAGSAPPGIEPCYITRLIACLQAAGAHAVIDMRGEFLKASCQAGAYLVKPNALEAGELTGMSVTSIPDALQALALVHRMGAIHVAISLGSLGAVYSDGLQACYAKAPSIEQHNPIGAGDAMLAGLVWAAQKSLPADEILRWGVACGAAAASLDGTAVGTLKQIETIVRIIKAEVWVK